MNFTIFYENRTAEQRQFLDVFKDLRKSGNRPEDVDSIMKYIQNMSKAGVSYSNGNINDKEIRNQLLQGGYYYVKTEVPVDKLFIHPDTEKLIRDNESENPSDKDHQKPIVTSTVDGHDFFVVDGRHRTIKAKSENKKTIEAVVPLKIYAKYFHGKNHDV